jgi:endoglucanase
MLILLAGGAEAFAATQVPAARLALLSRGINVDDIVSTGRLANYDSAAMAMLTSMGFTYVRIPIDPGWVIEGVPMDRLTDPSSADHAAAGLRRLDNHVAKFVQAGFPVVLCLTPGLKVRALPVADSEDIIRRSLTVIVNRYASKYTPDQLFFEELNEPHYTPDDWNALQPQLLAIIRAAAPLHTVIVPPSWNDIPQNFQFLTLADDQNVVYAMHVYQPAQATEQAVLMEPLPNYRFPRPPSSTDATEWSYDQMAAYMQPAFDWAKANKVPLIMTEFGSSNVTHRASRLNWISFVRQRAERHTLGWAWFAFDSKYFGLRPLGGNFDPDLVKALSH